MATATPPVYTETAPTVTAITPLLYRVEEAAEALRISRTQVYALICYGALRTVKIGIATTENVYRHELRPVMQTGARAMDAVFGSATAQKDG